MDSPNLERGGPQTLLLCEASFPVDDSSNAPGAFCCRFSNVSFAFFHHAGCAFPVAATLVVLSQSFSPFSDVLSRVLGIGLQRHTSNLSRCAFLDFSKTVRTPVIPSRCAFRVYCFGCVLSSPWDVLSPFSIVCRCRSSFPPDVLPWFSFFRCAHASGFFPMCFPGLLLGCMPFLPMGGAFSFSIRELALQWCRVLLPVAVSPQMCLPGFFFLQCERGKDIPYQFMQQYSGCYYLNILYSIAYALLCYHVGGFFVCFSVVVGKHGCTKCGSRLKFLLNYTSHVTQIDILGRSL